MEVAILMTSYHFLSVAIALSSLVLGSQAELARSGASLVDGSSPLQTPLPPGLSLPRKPWVRMINLFIDLHGHRFMAGKVQIV